MSVVIIIPARFASARYPGKPLVPLKGATGMSRTLLERSWCAARQVAGIDRILIATDDALIADTARAFGAEVVMTSPDCANGTERCAQVLEALEEPEIVVNLQGDAPLTPPWFVEDLVSALRQDPTADMATPVLRCDGRALRGFLEDAAAGRKGATTAVFGQEGRALYFSKEVIPHTPTPYPDGAPTPVFHHVGVYAYRPASLRNYADTPAGVLERLEGLEQLRFLETGRCVRCVEVEARGRVFWELNNPEDVDRIEAILAETGIE